jgi:hypothetical protein
MGPLKFQAEGRKVEEDVRRSAEPPCACALPVFSSDYARPRTSPAIVFPIATKFTNVCTPPGGDETNQAPSAASLPRRSTRVALPRETSLRS